LRQNLQASIYTNTKLYHFTKKDYHGRLFICYFFSSFILVFVFKLKIVYNQWYINCILFPLVFVEFMIKNHRKVYRKRKVLFVLQVALYLPWKKRNGIGSNLNLALGIIEDQVPRLCQKRNQLVSIFLVEK